MYTTKKNFFFIRTMVDTTSALFTVGKIGFSFFMAGFGGKLLSSLGCLISMYGLRIVWFQTF